MAIDLYPYSQRNGGRVTDLEHEDLWRAFGDVVLPRQAADALAVTANGSTVSVQPGKLLISGHILNVDSVQSFDTPVPFTASWTVAVVAEIDRSQSPWTYEVKLVLGVPGGGMPLLQRSETVRYQVALGSFSVNSSAVVTNQTDLRPRVQPFVLQVRPDPVQEDESQNLDNVSAQNWTNGNPLLDATFVAPPSGRVELTVYCRGMGNGTGALVTGYSLRRGHSGGPLIHSPRFDDGPVFGEARETASEVSNIVTGLTAGETYYVRFSFYMTSGTGNIRHRRLIIKPA